MKTREEIGKISDSGLVPCALGQREDFFHQRKSNGSVKASVYPEIDHTFLKKCFSLFQIDLTAIFHFFFFFLIHRKRSTLCRVIYKKTLIAVNGSPREVNSQ